MSHKLFFLTLFASSTLSLSAQKKFEVELQFPPEFNLEKLRIQIYDGINTFNADYIARGGNKVVVSGTYISKYAAIILNYPETTNMNFRENFFLTEKPGKIKFLPVANDSSPFTNYQLTEVYDFKSEKAKLDANVKHEVNELRDLYLKYGKDIFEGRNQILSDEFFKLEAELYRKIIEFIKENSKSYYSFWYYMRNAQFSQLPIDSLLTVFNSFFPSDFINSQEGVNYQQLLQGKMLSKGSHAPDFVSEDISGKRIKLSSFRGRKYVLLSFWATWCGPCIEEMPKLKEIEKKYSPDKLEIISVAYPTSIEQVNQVIEKHSMTWINIYNDSKLINSYGGGRAIPIVYLIDPEGKIIYFNQEKDIDAHLVRLRQLLESTVASWNGKVDG